jgi:primosomal protein N' (replication factor Y)
MILQVALDTPLRRVFDYLPPAALESPPPAGVRVRVPFGRRQLIGILVGTAAESLLPPQKLKTALEVLDPASLFDPVTFDLLGWAAEYYHHPIGEVFAAALPVSLRDGAAVDDGRRSRGAPWTAANWAITARGRAALAAAGDGAATGDGTAAGDATRTADGTAGDRLLLRRAPRQRALLEWLSCRFPSGGIGASDTAPTAFKPAHWRALADLGLIAPRASPVEARAPVAAEGSRALDLTEAQTAAVRAILAAAGRYAALLLDGVTGSGKTEVYLRAIGHATASGGQCLVLVPEIALTPQLVARFEERFGGGIAVMHSGLTASQRRDAWRRAQAGAARIVIGTRSAVFASLPRLALIVVDEEHDGSYKQHEGFRYSARDLAVLRAQRAAVPIVLGSATPSLESLENVAKGRYTRLSLPQRPGAALPPQLLTVDLRRHACEQGLSQPALAAIGRHLSLGGQVIVFLNRRGYAPTLFCNHCGWVAPCAHCDARMTLHRQAGQLRCHHCGAHGPVPATCGACGEGLVAVGQGTERVEETLTRLYPGAPLVRLDRDTAAPRGGLGAVLERVGSGAARILVGTQMLTKGHHFPDVSLVVILDADQGLFATDYRATERLAQTIIQVAGRAGRASRAGEVLIQTEFPDHPLLQRLIGEGYGAFAAEALAERSAAGWPPYSHLALLRAEARDAGRLDAYLRAAAARAPAAAAVKIQGPAPALLARRADHYRAHLLLEAGNRSVLQRFLAHWLPRVEALAQPPGLRWSIDVDPLEVD